MTDICRPYIIQTYLIISYFISCAAAYGLRRKSICPIWQREEAHIKYSVIIPVYNAEKYIEKCVCSLLQSAPPNEAEIILVNDGSADSSAKICQMLSREHECVKFINKSHGGASSARNTGLEAAIGEFVLFCDADDYVAPHYFNEIEKFKNEDLIIFAYTLILSIPKSTEKFRRRFQKATVISKSLQHFTKTAGFMSFTQKDSNAA